MLEDATVGVGQFETATPHHTRRNLHERVDRDVGESCLRTAVLETRYELSRKTGSVEVDTHTDNSGGIEHAVYTGLGVVAHDEATELQVGPHEALRGIVPDPDLRIIVLEIARIGACPDVAPLPYHGVAEIAVVRLVAESEHDSVVDLSAYLAIWAESGAAINLRSHPDLCIVAEGKRTA